MAERLRDSPYVDHLLALPFLKRAAFLPEPESSRHRADAILELTTPRGRKRLLVEEKTSHLSTALVNELIARISSGVPKPLILLAPYVSPDMGRLLSSHGINFVDRAGNCHIDLGGSYIGHIEGRKLKRPPDAPGGMRAPGVRLVFALLVKPDLLDRPIRELALAAGVSLGTASNVLGRLEQDAIVVKSKSKMHLVRREHLVQRWIAGYTEMLRQQLLIGRFETADKDAPTMQERVALVFGADTTWAWGGATGAYRLTQHFRSDETVLHVEAAPRDVVRQLNASPSNTGRLVVLGVPNALAFEGRAPRTVHPLLIYTELILTGEERALETAAELRERFLEL